MIKQYWFLLLFLALGSLVHGQIRVDTNLYTPEELIRDVLVNSPCAQIENVTFYTGTAGGNNGLGYFIRNNSNFTLDEGILLSTGNALNAEGPNPADGSVVLSDGGFNGEWVGDVDLEQAIGLDAGTTFNSTVLEFDFIPTANRISFNFLLASEEYYENFQCDFSDSFAFLLRLDNGTDEYQNLAVIPGTTTPISVVNVHPVTDNCPAINEEYFDRYNFDNNSADSAINFNGQTKVFNASSDVVPNERYHIKLVIADSLDEAFDSAVFLEAGSFDLGGTLGKDRTIASGNPGCTGTPVVLDASVGDTAIYQWRRNGIDIPGATNATYEVMEDGEYSVSVELQGTCNNELDPVRIEFVNPPQIENTPIPIILCSEEGNTTSSFDFEENTTKALGNQDPSQVQISYHLTQDDADNNLAPISLPFVNAQPSQTIYLRIADNTQNCYETAPFLISVGKRATLNTVSTFEICDDNTDGIAVFDFSSKIEEVLGGQSESDFNVAFYTSQDAADAAVDGTEITGNFENSTNPQEIFIRVSDRNLGACYGITSFNLVVSPSPEVAISVNLQACDADTDGFVPLNLEEARNLISDNHLNENFTFYKSRTDAEDDVNAIDNPTGYENTTPFNDVVYARVEEPGGLCYAISEVIITVDAVPVNLEERYVICLGKDGELISELPVIDTMLDENLYSFEWYTGLDENNLQLISGENQPFFVASEAATYWVQITFLERGCQLLVNTEVINSSAPNAINVERVDDIFSGNNIITITADGNGTYEYQLDDGDFQSNNTFRNVLFGERRVTVRDIFGCDSLSETIMIIDSPKYFSPNGDNVRDTWQIVGVELLENVSIYIFDRYGRLITQLDAESEGWDGTVNGRPLPESDYWVKIRFTENGQERLFNGHFSLKR